MIITPHLLVGAAIGAKVKNFGWIIVLALLSHFVLDKIPHWDYGKKIEELPRDHEFGRIVFRFMVKTCIDGLVGLIILFFVLLQKNMIRVEYLTPILVGIIVSLLPDFILAASKLLIYKSKLAKTYIEFHRKFFHSPIHIFKPTLLGLGTELLIGIIAILVLLIT